MTRELLVQHTGLMLPAHISCHTSLRLDIELLPLDPQVLLELASLAQLIHRVAIQRALVEPLIVVALVWRMRPDHQIPESHREGNLIEAQHEAHTIPADVWEEAEYPIHRDEGKGSGVGLGQGRGQLNPRSRPPATAARTRPTIGKEVAQSRVPGGDWAKNHL